MLLLHLNMLSEHFFLQGCLRSSFYLFFRRLYPIRYSSAHTIGEQRRILTLNVLYQRQSSRFYSSDF